MTHRKRATRDELLEILGDIFATDPEVGEAPTRRCFWCMAAMGQHHEETCTWVQIAQIIDQGEAAVARRVGEGLEDAMDRLEDEEDAPVRRQVHRLVADRVEEALDCGDLDSTLDLLREIAKESYSCQDDPLDPLPEPELIQE